MRCEATHPTDQRQCKLESGHDGQHEPEPISEAVANEHAGTVTAILGVALDTCRRLNITSEILVSGFLTFAVLLQRQHGRAWENIRRTIDLLEKSEAEDETDAATEPAP